MQMREKNKTKKDRDTEARQEGQKIKRETEGEEEKGKQGGETDSLKERKKDMELGERGGGGRRRKV